MDGELFIRRNTVASRREPDTARMARSAESGGIARCQSCGGHKDSDSDMGSTRQTGKPGGPDGEMLKRHGSGRIGSV